MGRLIGLAVIVIISFCVYDSVNESPEFRRAITGLKEGSAVAAENLKPAVRSLLNRIRNRPAGATDAPDPRQQPSPDGSRSERPVWPACTDCEYEAQPRPSYVNR